MTTKETEIPTFYLTKKKKKQIYKITVWNVLLVVVFFLQDLFSYLKETLNLLRSTLWQVGTGIKQGNLFILQGWDVNHRCLKANGGRRRGQSSRHEVIFTDSVWKHLGCFLWEGMTLANGVAMNSFWRAKRFGLHVHSAWCQSDLCPSQGPLLRPRLLGIKQAAQMLHGGVAT